MIRAEGFSPRTLELIDKYINDILYGTGSFPRFNISEHAGLCTAGAPLIGASVVAGYARASLETGADAAGGQGGHPSNWQIDELQEILIEHWAKAANLWEDHSEEILVKTFGPKIAEGAEAKVYYRSGDTSVVKERASISLPRKKPLKPLFFTTPFSQRR